VFPLKDDVPTRSAPIVTVMLITLNVLLFLYQVSLELDLDAPDAREAARAAHAFIAEFGLVPCRLTGLCQVPPYAIAPALTIFTSMFLHGGLFHVAGNMLYLWIFGNNVEDTLGHLRFTAFYFLSGLLAGLIQISTHPGSEIPMIGASGAVSGVLGAYLLLFPGASVQVLMIFGFFWRVGSVPAILVLGLWIVVQILNGLGSFGAGGGVAWFAHIGGFFGGMALLFVMRPRLGLSRRR
jgi:membrane associated rhomboid family serine protease